MGYEEVKGEVIIPNSVQYNGRTLSVIKIGASAFEDCNTLTSIVIPTSVTEIGRRALYSCKNLKSAKIPSGVTSIAEEAFYECSSLASVDLPNSVATIGKYAFYQCTSLASINLPNNIKEIPSRAFAGCTSLKTVVIPNAVKVIGIQAFFGCSSLISVKFPDSVTTIGAYAFYDCTSLTPIIIPHILDFIGEYAFGDCHSLKSVTILDCKESGYEPFSGCYPSEISVGSESSAQLFAKRDIKKITLMSPDSDFSNYEFYGCGNLETIVSQAITPPRLNSYNLSENQKASLKVYVPKGSLAAYQAADVWKEFWNIEESDEATDINTAKSDRAATIVGVYTLSGEKISAPRRGINIIKMGDGTVKKVIMR